MENLSLGRVQDFRREPNFHRPDGPAKLAAADKIKPHDIVDWSDVMSLSCAPFGETLVDDIQALCKPFFLLSLLSALFAASVFNPPSTRERLS